MGQLLALSQLGVQTCVCSPTTPHLKLSQPLPTNVMGAEGKDASPTQYKNLQPLLEHQQPKLPPILPRCQVPQTHPHQVMPQLFIVMHKIIEYQKSPRNTVMTISHLIKNPLFSMLSADFRIRERQRPECLVYEFTSCLLQNIWSLYEYFQMRQEEIAEWAAWLMRQPPRSPSHHQS